MKRVNEYVALHKKLEETLPKLPEADRRRKISTRTSGRSAS